MKKLNKKGFTIVELVIVIAVIGILAGVLIPTFTIVVRKANQSAAIQALDTARKEYMTEVDAAADDFSAFDTNVAYEYLVSKKGTDYEDLSGFWQYADGAWDKATVTTAVYTARTTETYSADATYSLTNGGKEKTFADEAEFNTFVASNTLYIVTTAGFRKLAAAESEADNNNIAIYVKIG